MFNREAQEANKFDVYEVQSELSNHDYHKRSEISSSFIKGVHKHSAGRVLAPKDFSESKALLFGDAFHEYMQYGKLTDRFVVMPDELSAMDGRKKEVKDWKEENSSRIILSRDDDHAIKSMSRSALAHQTLIDLSSPRYEFNHEWSFFADGDDERTSGMKFRIRPDLHISHDGRVVAIVDWKTTDDLAKLIKWGFFDLGYDIQAVFYSDVLGVHPSKFLFVCIEKQPPYSARVITLSEETIERARDKMNNSIRRIKEWKADPNKTDLELPQTIQI